MVYYSSVCYYNNDLRLGSHESRINLGTREASNRTSQRLLRAVAIEQRRRQQTDTVIDLHDALSEFDTAQPWDLRGESAASSD